MELSDHFNGWNVSDTASLWYYYSYQQCFNDVSVFSKQNNEKKIDLKVLFVWNTSNGQSQNLSLWIYQTSTERKHGQLKTDLVICPLKKLNWDNCKSSTEISNIRKVKREKNWMFYFPTRQYKDTFKVLLDTPEPQPLQIIFNLLICFLNVYLYQNCLWKSFIINYTTAQTILLLFKLLLRAAWNWCKIIVIDHIWWKQ